MRHWSRGIALLSPQPPCYIPPPLEANVPGAVILREPYRRLFGRLAFGGGGLVSVGRLGRFVGVGSGAGLA